MTDQPKYCDPVLQAIAHKHHALLVTGNIFDLTVEPENRDLFYRPLYLAEKMYEQDKIVMSYSRSSGLTVHRERKMNKNNKIILEGQLTDTGLKTYIGSKKITPEEVIEVFRGFKKIARSEHSVPFVFLVDYVSHLTSRGSADREMQIVAETINEIANSPSVQKSGNVLVVFAHEHDESNLNPLLKHLHKVHYGYPNRSEYEQFFEILKSRNEEYASTDLSSEEATKSSRGLNLSQLTALFKEGKAKGETITRGDLIKEKERVIEKISESTLTVLPTDIAFDDLAGLQVTKRILSEFARKLANQDPSSPRAILLAGPPGTGKTTITSALANACGYNLVELSDEIKSKWVGESEARLALALSLIESLAPVILFIDEFDQAFSNRSDTSLDGGVSSHYLKTLFKFAARDDLRGKICIVACSNTPQRLDPAMINRFITIPLLEATPKEMAAIFPKIEQRITGNETLDPDNEDLILGCESLYKNGTSPRQIFDVINHTLIKYGTDFSEKQILESCRAFRSSGDPDSGAFSSLSAIRLTAFEDYFPWAGDKSYPLPWYLEGVVNTSTGTIHEEELNRKLREFETKARF